MSGSEPILLITGAAGGLGRTVTARLLSSHARVIASGRDLASLRHLETSLANPPGLISLSADLSDSESVRALFEQAERDVGPITGVAHLVGGYHGGTPLEETSDEIWDHMIRLNLRSTFLVLREAVRRMRPRCQGSIVSISSAASIPGVGAAGAAAYAASKAGVNALTEATAEECKSSGVRVNALLPSLLRTQANIDAMPDADHSRWVSPDEVAEIVSFLLSPAASGVTGALIKLAGRQ